MGAAGLVGPCLGGGPRGREGAQRSRQLIAGFVAGENPADVEEGQVEVALGLADAAPIAPIGPKCWA